MPTMIAVGVASPIAHGQAMTSTATALISALKQEAGSVTAAEEQPDRKVSAARPMHHRHERCATPGRPAAGSGALLPCACCTSRTICASAVSRPTLVASNLSRPCLLSVAPDDLVARAFVDRQALAGEHGLVHRRAALDDHAIDRDLLAGTHDDMSPTALVHRHVDLLAIAHARARSWRCSPISFLIALGGAALGARFQQLAQHDQGDDHRGSLKVDVPQRSWANRVQQQHGHAVDVGHAGAHRDQHIHVGAAVAQAL